MSTALANPAEMIRKGAPHVIHSDEELAEYTKALFELTAKSDPTPEEKEAIELLTLLIERYETEHYPIPDADPLTVLRFLLDQNGLSQRDIAPESRQREYGITGSCWQASVEPRPHRTAELAFSCLAGRFLRRGAEWRMKCGHPGCACRQVALWYCANLGSCRR